MRVIRTISSFGDVKKGCVLTIGNFDGVHIGHQAILTVAAQAAMRKQTELVAMIFDPHPTTILHPDKNIGILTPLELKENLLVRFGIDCLFILKSTLELLSLSSRDFVQEFVVKSIQPDTVIEGEDFNFGSGRHGNIHTLNDLGVEEGFNVRIIASKQVRLTIGQSVRVSSTLIRNMLEGGRVADTAIAMGRPYRLIGQVVPGHGRGKRLGFPTANMKPPQQAVPGEGVYAGLVHLGDSFKQVCTSEDRKPAVFSIGQAKTYGSDNPFLIEAHLLTNNVGQLTGKWMGMDFIKRIRDQIEFDNESLLAKRIAKDCEQAKQMLDAV